MVNSEREIFLHEIGDMINMLHHELDASDIRTSDDCTALQNKLIEVGEYLERRFGLEGSEFIKELELLCETLYIYSVEGIPENGREYIAAEIEKLPSVIENICGERVLSIGVIVKNELPYIEEWLEYHLMLGVEHFYIYDNNSTDGLYEFLQAYIENGVVTYIPQPVYNQVGAYYDACTAFKYATKYLAFIDVDEFLVPVEDKALPEVVEEIFGEFPYAGGLAVNWRVYGSSFFEDKPEGMVIENYVYRQEGIGTANLARKFNPADNAHVKTICNPRRVAACNNPHFFQYIDGAYQISEYGTVFSGPFFAEGRCDKLRLNHYYTKSKSEFFERRRKGVGDLHISEETINALWDMYKDTCNQCRDEIMARYVEVLKERIND